jgi:hypothetical protein
MDCHPSPKTSKNTRQKGHLLHLILMVLCCGLPVVLLAALPIISQFSPAVGEFLRNYAWTLCPILMVPMLIMMAPREKDHDQEEM